MSDGKKRLSAIGGLALGLVGADAMTDADGVTERGVAGTQPLQQGLVFAYDYQPRVPFEVVDQLPQPTVNHIAGRTPSISDPDDYNGHVIAYKPGQPRALDQSPGEYAFVLVKETTLGPGTTYMFTGSARVFSTGVNLLTGTIESVSTETTTETATETTTETTATETTTTETQTENGTTMEVNVTETTTPTNESG